MGQPRIGARLQSPLGRVAVGDNDGLGEPEAVRVAEGGEAVAEDEKVEVGETVRVVDAVRVGGVAVGEKVADQDGDGELVVVGVREKVGDGEVVRVGVGLSEAVGVGEGGEGLGVGLHDSVGVREKVMRWGCHW